jgi:hypothetical protein
VPPVLHHIFVLGHGRLLVLFRLEEEEELDCVDKQHEMDMFDEEWTYRSDAPGLLLRTGNCSMMMNTNEERQIYPRVVEIGQDTWMDEVGLDGGGWLNVVDAAGLNVRRCGVGLPGPGVAADTSTPGVHVHTIAGPPWLQACLLFWMPLSAISHQLMP